MDTEEQLQTRVAWYYYIGNLTQQQIANRIGISRVRVNRLLAVCRENGLVQITINGKLAACVELEHALVERYSLKDAVVVPTPENPEYLRDAIGVGAGTYVSTRIRDGDTIGVGWGRTLLSVLRSVQGRSHRSLSVVSLLGGLSHCSGINTFEIVSDFADLFDADCHFFAAPVFASSEEARDLILQQEAIRETYERARNADMAILTLGDLVDSLIVTYGLHDTQELDSVRAAGAVGDIIGHFVDAYGAPVNHPLNGRAVALGLEDLRRIKQVVVASGGLHKLEVTRAALRGSYVSVLVTDEVTARRLV